jgi:hypothetical protein
VDPYFLEVKFENNMVRILRAEKKLNFGTIEDLDGTKYKAVEI